LTSAWLTDTLELPVVAVEWERAGEEFGFANSVLRGRVRYAAGQADSIVAKLPGRETVQSREERFYRRVGAPFAPRFRGAADGVLLLEDVQGRQGDILAGCSLHDVHSVLESVGRFHAEHAGRDLGFQPWGADPQGRQERYLARVDSFLEHDGDTLPREAVGIADALRTQLAGLVAELATGPSTLIHGDLHLDNMIFAAAADRPVVVLDWQLVAAGPATYDVALFVATSPPVDDRRASEAELLATYAKLSGRDEAELRTAYARALLVVFAGLVSWLGAPERPGAGEREREVRRAALGDGRVVAAVLDHAAEVVRPRS
jgi:hypothetical protein